MTAPTPQALASQVHRPTPDGTRQLIFRENPALRSAQSSQPRTCRTATIYAHTGGEPPAECQRVIEPGRFYLLYTPIHPSTEERGGRQRFCAPCAARDFGPHFSLREATP